jgi:hypothetical protein
MPHTRSNPLLPHQVHVNPHDPMMITWCESHVTDPWDYWLWMNEDHDDGATFAFESESDATQFALIIK